MPGKYCGNSAAREPSSCSVAFRSIASYLADLEACQHPPCEISIAARRIDKCASPSKRCLTYPSLQASPLAVSFLKGKLKATDYTFCSQTRCGWNNIQRAESDRGSLSFSFGDEQLARKRHRAPLKEEISCVWVFYFLFFFFFF